MPDDELAHLVGRTLLQRYRLLRVLGGGGMGIVFEAADLRGGAVVAVKVLHRVRNSRTALKRFQREAQTAARVGRPHAVDVHAVGALDSGEPFFVMERLVGETLRDRMVREGRVPPLDDTLSIFVQLLSALEAVHAQGVVHRDIKPENIFLLETDGPEPIAKLIDFGVAKLHDAEDDGSQSTRLTETGIVVGTIGYIAPEQISNQDNTARADLWACGVTLYEVLTGRRPFHGKTPVQVMMDILNRQPVPPHQIRPTLTPKLDQIVLRALRKPPEERFRTADEFRRALIEVSILRRRNKQRETSARPPVGDPVPAPIVLPGGEATSTGALRVPVFELPRDLADILEPATTNNTTEVDIEVGDDGVTTSRRD